ncbi:hypothetical protein GCM10025867_39660 [Frondihabitans sucicola]|uniref:Uncharacterized protein n=1 Tax=Frondihabitans sucicola TaxID=1268041 RepID=A0ABM8GTB9_9MICO|nr:hypothetical protein GCM10025867_39660 [Frondihabitans sucicola]
MLAIPEDPQPLACRRRERHMGFDPARICTEELPVRNSAFVKEPVLHLPERLDRASFTTVVQA